MGNEDAPQIWIDHYDLNIGVQGSPTDTLEEVQEIFDEELKRAVERDPKLGAEDDETGAFQ